MLTYFDRGGNVLSKENWAKLFSKPAYRLVERMEVAGVRIEAAWVGIQSDLERTQSTFVVEALGWKTVAAKKEGATPTVEVVPAKWVGTERDAVLLLKKIARDIAQT